MMKKRAYQLGAVALTLFLVLPSPHSERARYIRKSQKRENLREKELVCGISLGKGLKESYKFGLNYEIARDFAKGSGSSIEIRILADSVNFRDSAQNGTYDFIVVKKACADSLDGLTHSFCYDGEHVWVLGKKASPALPDINRWLSHECAASEEFAAVKELFSLNYSPFKRAESGKKSRIISPYDDVIKRCSKEIGWDWRLVAALIYTESKFTINNISSRGAVGLMQVMPYAGRKFGAENLMDPDENIEAGTAIIRKLQNYFPAEEFTKEERINFTLAAFNAGCGRITDCRRFAAKRGKDNTKWNNVVEVIPYMKEDGILDDDEIRCGKFNGKQTIAYVRNVLGAYDAYRSICPD